MEIKDKKPSICYLRGSYLNPFEAQYLYPLLDTFDITVAHPKSYRYNVGSISMPRISFPCLDYLNGIIPRKIFGKKLPNPLKFLGFEEILFGVNKGLKKFDLIHLPEQSFYFSWQVVKNKKKGGYKIISTQDEINPYWYRNKLSLKKRTCLVRNETDLFISRSNHAKYTLICEGVSPEKIHVIGHGVDTKRFYPGERDKNICKSLGISDNRFIVLFVGNLIWTKGIFTLVDAVKLLLQDQKVKDIDPLFVIVGEGNERNQLIKKIKSYQLDRYFHLTGPQPYEKLPEIHRLADIFVLPSISTRYIQEQFGIVLIESMATGKPVISTYCGAIDEVVGDAGMLIPPNDYLRLYESLYNLMFNSSLREQLSRKGIERVHNNFTYKIIASKIASVYEEVLEK